MSQSDASQGPPSNEVDRIRDIILGPQIRDYNQRFEMMVRDLQRLQQLIDGLTEKLAEQGQTQERKLQEEAERQSRQLEQHGDSQVKRLQQVQDRLTKQLAELEGESNKRFQELRREARGAEDSLRQELRESVQTLGKDKADRLALAELLIEVGNQLKQGDSSEGLGGLLQNLDDATE